MEYSYELDITAGTTKAAPASVICRLSKGILHNFEITFLEGSLNQVSIAVFLGGFQCFPLNPDGAYKGNAETIKKTTFYPLESPPYTLVVKGWAPAAVYNHNIQLRFDVLPKEYFDQSGDTEAILKAVTGELAQYHKETTEQLADKIGDLAKWVTPAPAGDPEILENSGADGMELPVDYIGLLSPEDLAIIQAQLNLGWSDIRILAAHNNKVYPDPDTIKYALQQLRKQGLGVDNG